MRRPYGTPAGHTVSHARQSRHSDRWRTVESESAMRPSASDFTRKIRPRGESISVPSTENVGQYARHRPQCTHWLTPSTLSPWSVSGADGGDVEVVISDTRDEPAGVEHVVGVELGLDALHESAGHSRIVPHRQRRLHR